MAWLLLAPLPSALSRDLVSGVRSLPMVVPLIIISGIGLSVFSQKKFLLLLYSPALLLSFFYFLDLYFVHSQSSQLPISCYPYRPALQSIKSLIPDYKKNCYYFPTRSTIFFFLYFICKSTRVNINLKPICGKIPKGTQEK